jgi:hypothetical protein
MSGVILATAIGSGVAAAGGVGAVVAAGVGAGTTLYGGAKSFSDASKARKLGETAQRDLLKSMQEARRKIDVNVYEQLSIPKEPYELMREAALVQGATGMQAGVEGETRGAAATAGRMQMAQQAQQAGIRSSMGEQLFAIDQLVAQDDARIKQQLAGLAFEEAAGAQEAMRDAEEARAQAITQGVSTLGGIAEGLSSAYAAGDFGKANTRRQEGLANEQRLQGITDDAMTAKRRNEALRPITMSGLDAEGFEIPLDEPLTPLPGYLTREQELAGLSGRRVMREDLDPANRVGSVFGDPNIPDAFGPYTRNTMTMYDSFSEMPRGPRPLPPRPVPVPTPGPYAGLGFPSYLMYQ